MRCVRDDGAGAAHKVGQRVSWEKAQVEMKLAIIGERERNIDRQKERENWFYEQTQSLLVNCWEGQRHTESRRISSVND